MDETQQLLRRTLKVLLLQLAAKSPDPSGELRQMIAEVINELHDDVRSAIRERSASSLRLVSGSKSSDGN
jgi:hypothetical protein